MAYRKNNVMQVSMDDTFDHLSSRTQRIVVNSWAKPFADYVFPALMKIVLKFCTVIIPHPDCLHR